jgi:hypothetical protein
VRAETYLVVEVVVIELLDLPVQRIRDESTGLLLPDFDTETRQESKQR